MNGRIVFNAETAMLSDVLCTGCSSVSRDELSMLITDDPFWAEVTSSGRKFINFSYTIKHHSTQIDPFFTINIVNPKLNFPNIHVQLLMETKDMHNCNDDNERSSIICSASVSINSVTITSNQIHVNRPTKVVALRDIGRQYIRVFSMVSIDMYNSTPVTLPT